MEIYSIFYKGRWRKIGDKIWIFPLQRWIIQDIYDGSKAMIVRGKEFKIIEGIVKVY